MSKPTAVGCNIFAGLFTLGVSRHFNVLAHLEHDSYGAKTAQLNFPRLNVYTKKSEWPTESLANFIYCNTPCAVWSSVGKNHGKSYHDDPRLQRTRDALELLDWYRPQVWAWESVPYALLRGRSFFHEMSAYGHERGYDTTVLKINAKYLGVPQNRPRVFVVLHRVGFDPLGDLAPPNFDRVLTPRDVWEDLPPQRWTRGRDLHHKILMKAKPGDKLRPLFYKMTAGEDHPRNERGQVIGAPAFARRRVDLDVPASPMFEALYHPTQHRKLTTQEAMRLAQLPDTWKFSTPVNSDASLLLMQRAVMPRVGAWLARGVAKAIERSSKLVTDANGLIYDFTQPDRDIQIL